MDYQISVVSALFSLRQKYGKEFLTVSEAAHELGLAYGSFRNMLSEGRAPVPSVMIGGRRAIPLLGIAKLTFEALTGQKVEITFDSLGAGNAKHKEQKKPGRRRNPEPASASPSSKEVRHG